MLTTHHMDEAEQLCDRLVVIDGGRIVAQGSPRELIAQYATCEVADVRLGPADLPAGADGQRGGHDVAMAADPDRCAALGERVEALPDRLLIYTGDGEAAIAAVHERGVQPVSTLVRRATLEDVFLRLTGRSLVD